MLTLLQQVDTSLQDQTKSLDTLRHHINTAFSALLSDRQGFIHSQVKIFKLVPQIDPSVKLYNHEEGPY